MSNNSSQITEKDSYAQHTFGHAVTWYIWSIGINYTVLALVAHATKPPKIIIVCLGSIFILHNLLGAVFCWSLQSFFQTYDSNAPRELYVKAIKFMFIMMILNTILWLIVTPFLYHARESNFACYKLSSNQIRCMEATQKDNNTLHSNGESAAAPSP